MKANELMIGDWVGRVFDDKRIDYRQVDWIRTGEIGMRYQKVWAIGCIEPIPLTSEIFEKNGWIQCKYKTCKSLYEYKGLHLRHTMIKRSNGRWVANVEGIVEKFPDEYTHSFLRINVFYVHQLQQTLRLCGLNELAENFKV